MIPKGRLNEEIEKRRQLEERLTMMQSQMNLMNQNMQTRQAEPKVDDTDKIVQELAEEFGWDNDTAKRYYNKNKEIARREFAGQFAEIQTQQSGLMSKLAVKEVLDEMPRAKKYEADIVKRLNSIRGDPRLKFDKEVIKDVTRLVLGEKWEEMEKEAEERGRRSATEERKIVKGTGYETPSSGKPKAKVALTEKEREIAEKQGISEDEFAKYKSMKKKG
jgi:hypothetical protein